MNKPDEVGEDVLNHAGTVCDSYVFNRVDDEVRGRRPAGMYPMSGYNTPSKMLCSESDRKIVELDGGMHLVPSRRLAPRFTWCECDLLPGQTMR